MTAQHVCDIAALLSRGLLTDPVMSRWLKARAPGLVVRGGLEQIAALRDLPIPAEEAEALINHALRGNFPVDPGNIRMTQALKLWEAGLGKALKPLLTFEQFLVGVPHPRFDGRPDPIFDRLTLVDRRAAKKIGIGETCRLLGVRHDLDEELLRPTSQNTPDVYWLNTKVWEETPRAGERVQDEHGCDALEGACMALAHPSAFPRHTDHKVVVVELLGCRPITGISLKLQRDGQGLTMSFSSFPEVWDISRRVCATLTGRT